MTTPSNLTEEYIFAHDLRPASAKIYRASTKALLKHFGTASVEEIDHRAVLTWRKKSLRTDYPNAAGTPIQITFELFGATP